MRGVIIGTIIACAALIGLAVFFTVNGSGGGPRIVALDPAYEQRVQDGYWKKGAENASVVLTEYLDFQCPSCQAVFPTVSDAYAATNSYVQFRVKQYPIVSIHPNALAAARAAEAAGRQGKFWQMHDILFTKQSEWTTQSPALFKTTIETYAGTLGINMEQFNNDLKDRSLSEPIDKDMAFANQIPISGTPTFFLNDSPLPNPKTAQELIDALNAAVPVAAPTATPGA